MRRFLITVNGTEYEVSVQELDESAPAASAAPVASAKPAPAPAAPKTAAPAGATAVSAPMPGTILKLLVKEGDAVQSGRTLAVLEAMKMENDIPAPCDGVVASIAVKTGDSVSAGDVLLTLR